MIQEQLNTISNTLEPDSKHEKILTSLNLKRGIKDFLFIIIGIIMASIGLKGFLLPNHFLDGGAMGVSLILLFLTDIDLSLLILLVNAPFIFLGAKQFSISFAVKSTIAILILSVLVHVIEIPPVTQDKLLIAVFGGFFLGAGIGLTVRGGGVIDGTEVFAITISKHSSLTVGDFIAVFNILLFGIAAAILNIETAMYSMLTYIAASKTVDFLLNGIEEYIGVMIVSNESELLKEKIREKLNYAVTVFKSDEGYNQESNNTQKSRKILYCVITRLETTKLLREVKKCDPQAFIIQTPVKDTQGGMVKKRPLH